MSVESDELLGSVVLDQAALLLLEAAEFFRTHNPPKYKAAIKCVRYHGMKEAGSSYVSYRVEIACLLAEAYLQIKALEPAKQLLRQESAHSRDFPVSHARILFLLAETHALMNDWNNASEIVDAGALQFGQLGDPALECYFRLSSAMIVSMDLNREEELTKRITEVSNKLEAVSADNPCLDYMKAYCYVVQICFFISTGQM
ncbi:unnamed protein product [Gongylonema pulchrum]|uniref:Cohesin loading complex subunit SCC4 homolog n=1 Tax=Gongylonema pulchrum TaxID=637853 RepID=A0A183CY65_9BILA|nr:unnamed protein product [Gongylonema pulchrum]